MISDTVLSYDGVCPICHSTDGLVVEGEDGKYRNICSRKGCPAYHYPCPDKGYESIDLAVNPFSGRNTYFSKLSPEEYLGREEIITYEEALTELECFLDGDDLCSFEKRDREAVTIAVIAIKKRIKKAPFKMNVGLFNGKNIYRYEERYICPSCGKWLEKKVFPQYCECGQYLDWRLKHDL